MRHAVMLMVIFIFQGELFEILEDDKCLPEEQVQAIAKQLVFYPIRFFLTILGGRITRIMSYFFGLGYAGKSLTLFAFQPDHPP